MRTGVRVSFGLYVAETKADADLSTATVLQPFANVDLLENDNVNLSAVATYEPDYWLLSGRFRFRENDDNRAKVGFWSLEMSDSAGEFTSIPTITCQFSESHQTDGIGFRFAVSSGDYPSEVEVTYYLGVTQVEQMVYYPTDVEFSAELDVAGFDEIVIRFIKTHRPYRYMRVCGIDFGRLITFTGADIKTANLTEEINPLSVELVMNTFDLTIHSEDEQFSIMAPESYYTALRDRQPVTVYKTVGDTLDLIGQYYLEKWSNPSEQQIEFSCTDVMGIIDGIPFTGGMYADKPIVDLLDEILGTNAILYDLDSTLESTLITGWIPRGSVREALQQVAFAAAASVDCSRSWSIQIKPIVIAKDVISSILITKDQKGMKQKVTLKPPVTAVKVISHRYEQTAASAETIAEDTLIIGTHEVYFTEPMYGLVCTGGVITESSANHAVITVSVEGVVTLTGSKYTDVTKPYETTPEAIPAGTKPNFIEISKAYLVNPSNVETIGNLVGAYFTQRYDQDVMLFAPDVKVGDVVRIQSLYGKDLIGMIEKMSTSLTHGHVVETKIVGDVYVMV